MQLDSNPIDWCESFKYLEISDSSLKFDINSTKRSFYAAWNSIFTFGDTVEDIAFAL